MRLTNYLLRNLTIRDVTALRWKRIWKYQAKFFEHPVTIPEALRKKGVNVVDVAKVQVPRERWIAPFDDPRFAQPVPLNEQPDWKEQPVLTHSSNVRLFEGIKQACLIAKAQHFDGFPSAVQRLIGAVEIPDKRLLLQRFIMQSQVWNTDANKLPKRFEPSEPRYTWKTQYGITSLRSSQILTQNLLRLSKCRVSDFPSLRNRKQVLDVPLNSHIVYNNQPVVMKEDLDMLLTSDQMLPPFADQSVVSASESHPLPDMWPVFPTVDFLQTNNYELTNDTGFKTGSSYACPHTIIQFPRKHHWKTEHYQASQIMSCLMYTSALARRKFGEGVTVLPEPISIQHILLNEDHFLLTFFQLNTLDLSSAAGVKNLVWTVDRVNLFQKVLGLPWMPMPLTVDHYQNFDASAFDKFLAVYLNGVPEVQAGSKQHESESV